MFAHDQVEPGFAGRDKTEKVKAMFDRIAPTYDLLNRLISAGLDQSWRRRLVRQVLSRSPQRVLDVATGTGDVAIAIARARVPEVHGVDISTGMLARGRTKAASAGLSVTFVEGDGLGLPYPDGHFDAVTLAFGLRNYADLARGLAELHRVTRPGGLVAILELTRPRSAVLQALHRTYTHLILPRVGRLISGERSAYAYLPASVSAFPPADEVDAACRDAGLVAVRAQPLAFGAATLFLAENGRRA